MPILRSHWEPPSSAWKVGPGQTVRPSLPRESICRGGSRRIKRNCPRMRASVLFPILLVVAVLVLATSNSDSPPKHSAAPAAKGRARPRERSRPLLRPGLRPAPRRPWPVRPPAPSASTAPRIRPPGCCSRLRRARPRACWERPGASTTPASGCPTAAPANSWCPGRRPGGGGGRAAARGTAPSVLGAPSRPRSHRGADRADRVLGRVRAR